MVGPNLESRDKTTRYCGIPVGSYKVAQPCYQVNEFIHEIDTFCS